MKRKLTVVCCNIHSLLYISVCHIQKKRKLYYYVQGIKIKLSSYFVRPDWEKCADVVSGGVVRWKELSDGKTSNDLVDALLSEIQAGGPVDSGGAEYFDGQVLYITYYTCIYNIWIPLFRTVHFT